MRKLVNRKQLTSAVVLTLMAATTTMMVHGETVDAGTVTGGYNAAVAEAKLDTQQHQVITAKDIERVQAKSAEDVVFQQSGVSRTVDAMGRVGVSIRGAEPRHTLILVDGQPVVGDFAKYQGDADELMRIGAENLARIEVTQGAASAKYGSGAIGGVINIITKSPQKEGQIKFNLESLRPEGSTGLKPYENAFFRVDSGTIGKAKLAVWGSKRDILPVYATKERVNEGDLLTAKAQANFEKNSLRYFGHSSNIGFSGDYDINENNKLALKVDHYGDNLKRFVKNTNSITEPSLEFKRNIKRDTVSLRYDKHVSDKTDINVETSYGHIKEDDIGLMSYLGKSIYRGNNILKSVDSINHTNLNFKIDAKTYPNEKHSISYGIGFNKEYGEGSRLKNSDSNREEKINPMDYDKNLTVDNKALSTNTELHDFKFVQRNGKTVWDKEYEWYGYDPKDAKTSAPEFTYEEFESKNDPSNAGKAPRNLTDDEVSRLRAFGEKLYKQNTDYAQAQYLDFEADYARASNDVYWTMIQSYYTKTPFYPGMAVANYNGNPFKTVFDTRNNQVTIGKASISKWYAYVSDEIAVNDKTWVTPSLRLDKSSHFGTALTASLGYLHFLKGNGNHRLKANIGTSYNEPGLGELYYNWEQQGGTPFANFSKGGGAATLGWYWVGNRDLQPEKAVNVDLSLEGTKGQNEYRATVFYNNIHNYISTYYTGDEMDFYPEYNKEHSANGEFRYLFPPDMIYSFKNIGKARITGLELELKHKFNDRWSTKLGYTYLQALNMSDKTMPDRLLDKPKMKVDIGVNYNNEQNGWSGSLYGNYYIDMLDTNERSGDGNVIVSKLVRPGYATIERNYDKNSYKNKTYGIWNFILQKEQKNGTRFYFAIDNVLDYRDDARALPGRTFRVGVNFTFGADGKLHKVLADDKGNVVDLGPVELQDFFSPTVHNDKLGTVLYGEASMTINAHGGENRPKIRATQNSTVASALKNMMDVPEHGMDNRVVVGLDAHVSANTNIEVEGSFSGSKKPVSAIDVGESRGLGNARLEKANLTTTNKKWTYALGKVGQSLGATSYWFDGSFVGAKAMYSAKNTEVTVGYGDFSSSTGIADSPYTRGFYGSYDRPPTMREVLGVGKDNRIANEAKNLEGKYLNFQGRIDKAQTNEERLAILKDFVSLIKSAYPEAMDGAVVRIKNPKVNYSFVGDEKYGDKKKGVSGTTSFNADRYNGRAIKNLKNEMGFERSFSDPALFEGDGSAYITNWLDKNQENLDKLNTLAAAEDASSWDPTYKNRQVVAITDDMDAIKKKYVAENLGKTDYSTHLPSYFADGYNKVKANLFWDTEQGTSYPRERFTEAVGITVPASGYILNADEVPAIHRALFVNVAHRFNPRMGAKLWFMHSTNDDKVSFSQGNTSDNGKKTFNDTYTYDKVANVLGIGLQYQLGHQAKLSMDYGKNFTSLGKFLNGESQYNYNLKDKTATVTGYDIGSAPSFYTIRLDLGRADYNRPGSWNGYVDYKSFQHGSFFGGNGTMGLPDRYLDGIKSYTVGGAYVPMKQMMVKVAYTFGATGTKSRDTLFGPETFTLGDYSRVEMSYRF